MLKLVFATEQLHSGIKLIRHYLPLKMRCFKEHEDEENMKTLVMGSPYGVCHY